MDYGGSKLVVLRFLTFLKTPSFMSCLQMFLLQQTLSLRFFQACNIFIDTVTRRLDASWLNVHWGKTLLNLQ